MKGRDHWMWILGLGALAALLVQHYLVFFWVGTEAQQGVIQRIFYVHVPSAWTGFMAAGIAATGSAVYLWLGDRRADSAAVAAAEGALVFLTLMLVSGPLWAKVAWGVYWQWDPRLTMSLLLWVIFVGYFLVRSSVDDEERGRRLSAVVAIIGAVMVPFVHLSVYRRSIHPEPVVLKPERPTLDGDMLTTLMVGLAAFTLLFFALFRMRYRLAQVEAASNHGEGSP